MASDVFRFIKVLRSAFHMSWPFGGICVKLLETMALKLRGVLANPQGSFAARGYLIWGPYNKDPTI